MTRVPGSCLLERRNLLQTGSSGTPRTAFRYGCDPLNAEAIELLARVSELMKEAQNRVGQGTGIEPVDHVLTASLVDDEVGLPEYGEVT
jgi:hypothetical protein